MKVPKLMYLVPYLAIMSCGSFESVKDTGKLAQGLNEYKAVYTERPCDVGYVFTESLTESCLQFENKDSVRIKAFDLLVAYGKTLEKFVENSDLDSGDQIEVLLGNGNSAGWTDLNDDQISGAKKIADATHSLMTNTVKRKALKNQIEENNNALQMIVSSLKGDLELRKEIYKNILLKMQQYFNEDSEFDADRREVMDRSESNIGYVKRNRLDRISIKFIEKDLISDTAQIANSIKALTAFGNAHNILAENFKKIGTKSDHKVVDLIMDDLENIYAGIKELRLEKE